MKGTVKKKNLKLAVAAAVLAAAAGTAVFFVYRSQTVAVEYVTAEQRRVTDWYKENGTLSLGDDFVQLSAVSGDILEISVTENQTVREGDVLLRIDPQDYAYERTLAEAELTGLRAQLDVERVSELMTASPAEYLASVKKQFDSAGSALEAAATVWNADQALYAAGDISRLQYEADKAAYEAALAAYDAAKSRYEESTRRQEALETELRAEASEAMKSEAESGQAEAARTGGRTLDELFYEGEAEQLRAGIQAAETRISQLEDKIANCTVCAGKSGIIKSLPAKGQSAVVAGTVLCTIAARRDDSAETLYAEADILTNAAAYIRPGTPVRAKLSLRGTDTVWNGSVTEVYDYAEKSTSALGLDEYRVHVKAELETDASANALEIRGLDGYGVELSFCLYDEDALALPVSAVYRSGDDYYVYTVENGRAVSKPVGVSYSTGSTVVLSDGLAAGDRVIDHISSEKLHEGARVRR